MKLTLDKLFDNGISYNRNNGVIRYEVDTGYCEDLVNDEDRMRGHVRLCNDVIMESLREDDFNEDFEVGFKGGYVGEYIGVLERLKKKAKIVGDKFEKRIKKANSGFFYTSVICGGALGYEVGNVLFQNKIDIVTSVLTGGVIGAFLSKPVTSFIYKLSDLIGYLTVPLYRRREEYRYIFENIDEESMNVYTELIESIEDDEDY